MITHFNRLIRYFRSKFNNLQEAIHLCKLDNIHSTIIMPKQMGQLISRIKTSSDVKFPFDDGISEVARYADSTVHTKITDGHILLFIVEIPLVENVEYRSYNILPLPSFDPNNKIIS